MSIFLKKFPTEVRINDIDEGFLLYSPSHLDCKYEIRFFWNENVDPEQQTIPQKVTIHTRGKSGLDKGWLYKKSLYIPNDSDITPDDFIALVNQEENKRRIQLEKAHALQAMREQLDSGRRREPIPQEVKITIWQRDLGRCVQCGANSELEFDHIIPLAMGGSNTVRNLQLLCALCNRSKGASLG